MSVFQFAYPTPIFFGAGARRKIESVWKQQNLKRPLVVTDRDLGKLPVFQQFMDDLKICHLEAKSFSGIWGNPVRSQVHQGVKAFHEHGADSVLVMGGGASLDCAKVIAMLTTNPGDLFDYEWSKKPIENELPFLGALPTTAGTGSEAGRASLISDDETHAKKIFFDQKLLPKTIFADPELTIGLPAGPTAATGMDALTHLVEAFVAKGYHPMADGIALEGIRKVQQSLKSAVRFAKKNPGATPEHIKARSEMLMAALMGAVAFQKGLGITHSCANALTTHYELHHGLVNGILLPYILEWNQEVIPDSMERLAKTIELPSGKDFIAWVHKLKSQIGIPKKLSEVGVQKDKIKELAEHAVADGCTAENPRETSLKDFELIFEGAI